MGYSMFSLSLFLNLPDPVCVKNAISGGRMVGPMPGGGGIFLPFFYL